MKIMKIRNGYLLTAETTIPALLEKAFDFFSHAENLQRITPPWVNFRFITQPPEEMRKGTRILYSIRLHGLPLRWLTEITTWEPPFRFVDTQLKGPYKKWIHEHRFEALGDKTRMIDTVDYQLPLGGAGRLAHRLWVRRDIEKIFHFRQAIIEELYNQQ